MANLNIDYAATSFEYLILTKIHGMLSYKSQRKIKSELKANAVSAPCDSGGGPYGHLGLVLTVAEYVKITSIVCVRPLHAGILNIVVGTSNYEVIRLSEKYKELVRPNRESNNVEKSYWKSLVRHFLIFTSKPFETNIQTHLQMIYKKYYNIYSLYMDI